MTETFDDNGDFGGYGDGPHDFKRKMGANNNNSAISIRSDENDEEQEAKTSEKVNEYLRELLAERNTIDDKYPHAERLLDQGEWIICTSSLVKVKNFLLDVADISVIISQTSILHP